MLAILALWSPPGTAVAGTPDTPPANAPIPATFVGIVAVCFFIFSFFFCFVFYFRVLRVCIFDRPNFPVNPSFFFPPIYFIFFFLNLYRNIYIFFFFSVSCPAERLPQARRPEIISSQSRRFQVSKCCFVDVYCNNYTVVVQCVFSNCIIIIIFFFCFPFVAFGVI